MPTEARASATIANDASSSARKRSDVSPLSRTSTIVRMFWTGCSGSSPRITPVAAETIDIGGTDVRSTSVRPLDGRSRE